MFEMRSLEWHPHALVSDDNLTENLSLRNDTLLVIGNRCLATLEAVQTILAFLRVLDDMETSRLASLHEKKLCGTQLVIAMVAPTSLPKHIRNIARH
ncbi:hypothetical protein Tco_0225636, partial [Tanacetum coccineum]